MTVLFVVAGSKIQYLHSLDKSKPSDRVHSRRSSVSGSYELSLVRTTDHHTQKKDLDKEEIFFSYLNLKDEVKKFNGCMLTALNEQALQLNVFSR